MAKQWSRPVLTVWRSPDTREVWWPTAITRTESAVQMALESWVVSVDHWSLRDGIWRLLCWTEQPITSDNCQWQYGVFPHATSCTRYWHCWNGTATIQQCPFSLLYNDVIHSCDWPDNVPDCQKHRKWPVWPTIAGGLTFGLRSHLQGCAQRSRSDWEELRPILALCRWISPSAKMSRWPGFQPEHIEMRIGHNRCRMVSLILFCIEPITDETPQPPVSHRQPPLLPKTKRSKVTIIAAATSRALVPAPTRGHHKAVLRRSSSDHRSRASDWSRAERPVGSTNQRWERQIRTKYKVICAAINAILAIDLCYYNEYIFIYNTQHIKQIPVFRYSNYHRIEL